MPLVVPPTDESISQSMGIQNPYTAQNFERYTLAPNKNTALINEVMTSAAEFESQLALMNYQNEYNSPVAQASRLRAAGINPDLAGVESGGVSASPGSVDANFPDSPAEPMDRALQGAGFLLGALQSSLAIYSGLQSYGIKEVAMADAVDQYAGNLLTQLSPLTGDPQKVTTGLSGKYHNMVLGQVKAQFGTPHHLRSYYSDKSAAGKYRDQYNQTVSSFTPEDQKVYDRTLQVAAQAAYRNMWNKELYDEGYYLVADPQSKGSTENARLRYENDFYSARSGSQAAFGMNAKDKYTSDYYGNLDGSSDANLHKLQTQGATERQEFENFQFSKNYLKFLFDKSQEGSKFASVLLNLLLMRQQSSEAMWQGAERASGLVNPLKLL